MKFDKILNILHEGIIENVNSLVTSSISLENSLWGRDVDTYWSCCNSGSTFQY